MADLAISIDIQTPEPKGGPGLTAAADAIMFDRLQEAVQRIQLEWPIKTGRSLNAWTVFRTGPLQYRLENQARDKYGAYAGFVHKKGDPAILAETLVIEEIRRAIGLIRDDFRGIATGGAVAQRASLSEALKERMRQVIRDQLVERSRSRTSTGKSALSAVLQLTR